MNKIVTFVVFLALWHTSFGQVSTVHSTQKFEERGMQLISDTQLSEVEIAQLLAFDFEPYREKNEYIIVKVVNGPNIQLFSSQRVETGKADPIVLQAVNHKEVADANPAEHKDVRAGELPIRMLQVKVVEVFNVDQVPN